MNVQTVNLELAGETGKVAVLLERARNGHEGAAAALAEAVHGELRQLARRYMRQERLDHTLQPTALVHEAYLRLFAGQRIEWKDHAHLRHSAARAMRQILVDHARKRRRAKRGAGFDRVPLDSNAAAVCDDQPAILLALDEALRRLRGFDPCQSEIVELLFFTGMTQEEVAKAMDISPRTVNREWRLARAWLHNEVGQNHAR